ncbi:MAG: hypothetical protein ACUVR0_11025 [Candidatus Aminicenantales bacterium]
MAIILYLSLIMERKDYLQVESELKPECFGGLMVDFYPAVIYHRLYVSTQGRIF